MALAATRWVRIGCAVLAFGLGCSLTAAGKSREWKSGVVVSAGYFTVGDGESEVSVLDGEATVGSPRYRKDLIIVINGGGQRWAATQVPVWMWSRKIALPQANELIEYCVVGRTMYFRRLNSKKEVKTRLDEIRTSLRTRRAKAPVK